MHDRYSWPSRRPTDFTASSVHRRSLHEIRAIAMTVAATMEAIRNQRTDGRPNITMAMEPRTKIRPPTSPPTWIEAILIPASRSGEESPAPKSAWRCRATLRGTPASRAASANGVKKLDAASTRLNVNSSTNTESLRVRRVVEETGSDLNSMGHLRSRLNVPCGSGLCTCTTTYEQLQR